MYSLRSESEATSVALLLSLSEFSDLFLRRATCKYDFQKGQMYFLESEKMIHGTGSKSRYFKFSCSDERFFQCFHFFSRPLIA